MSTGPVVAMKFISESCWWKGSTRKLLSAHLAVQQGCDQLADFLLLSACRSQNKNGSSMSLCAATTTRALSYRQTTTGKRSPSFCGLLSPPRSWLTSTIVSGRTLNMTIVLSRATETSFRTAATLGTRFHHSACSHFDAPRRIPSTSAAISSSSGSSKAATGFLDAALQSPREKRKPLVGGMHSKEIGQKHAMSRTVQAEPFDNRDDETPRRRCRRGSQFGATEGQHGAG
jgi:hypothetical protein